MSGFQAYKASGFQAGGASGFQALGLAAGDACPYSAVKVKYLSLTACACQPRQFTTVTLVRITWGADNLTGVQFSLPFDEPKFDGNSQLVACKYRASFDASPSFWTDTLVYDTPDCSDTPRHSVPHPVASLFVKLVKTESGFVLSTVNLSLESTTKLSSWIVYLDTGNPIVTGAPMTLSRPLSPTCFDTRSTVFTEAEVQIEFVP